MERLNLMTSAVSAALMGAITPMRHIYFDEASDLNALDVMMMGYPAPSPEPSIWATHHAPRPYYAGGRYPAELTPKQLKARAATRRQRAARRATRLAR